MKVPLNVSEAQAVTDRSGAAAATGFLVRSRHEMMRVFNGMLDAGTVIIISFMNSEDAVETMLTDVDEAGNRLLLECPLNWRGVAPRHGRGDSIMLGCVLQDAKIQFQSDMGEVIEVDDMRVLSLAIPDFMWRFQRRSDARHATPGLKITLNLGFATVDAELADIGMGGAGVLICDDALQLQVGEALSACQIALPGVGRIAADLTVQHLTPVRAPGGREVVRVGCRFAQLDDSTRQLMAHCLEALAAH